MKTRHLILILVILVAPPLYSETTMTITPLNSLNLDFSPLGLTEVETQIQDGIDSFGPAVADGFALANMGGYPIGSAYLGGFPSFFVGGSISTGLTNLDYRDETRRDDNRKPAGGVSPAVYFGMGMAGGLDLMLHFFTFSNGMYQPPLDKPYLHIDKLNLYSFGGRIRYNLVSKQTILPGLFSFGGITVSLGGDMLNGTVKVRGDIEYPLENIEIDLPGGATKTVNVDFVPQYSAKVKWYMVSVSSSILAYFDFFWLFGFYTGLGTSFNFGYFNMDLTGSGTASTTDTDYTTLVNSSGEIATIDISSSNKYNPHMVIPVYIVGFDISLFVIRFTAESMVNLRNKRDINLQFGARFQI